MVWGSKTVAENFEEDFAQFVLLLKEDPREGYPSQNPTTFWGGLHNTDLATGVEIPHALLRGPWTDETVRYLYWMLISGARIDWRHSTNGEV